MPLARTGFSILARRRLLNVPVWLWAVFALVSLVFVTLPQVDLAVSRFYYSAETGFEHRGTWYERLMHASVGYSLVLGNIALIVLWRYRGFTAGPGIDVTGKKLAFLLLFLALGPGLIVNSVLKENWGRARPIDVSELGGSKAFSPAFILSDQEGKSFTSGHAAASFYWLVAALLLAPGRKWWASLAALYCLTVSWLRIAAGGHYLSDVVTSFFLMAILALIMHGLAFEPAQGKGFTAKGTRNAEGD